VTALGPFVVSPASKVPRRSDFSKGILFLVGEEPIFDF
jgi:hypothetical protein